MKYIFNIFLSVYNIMSAYEPPEKALAIFDPSVFTSNDEPLTINTGSKYFLRYPYAQGTENFNALSANTITSSANLLLNPTGTINTNGKSIDASGGIIQNVSTMNSQNNVNIIIEGRGTGHAILKTNGSNRLVATDTGNINALNQIFMTSDTPANRVINSSLLALNENTGVYNSTLLGQIYQTTSTMNFQNLVNSGTEAFIVKDGTGTNFTPMSLNSSGTTFNRPVTIVANNNLTMNSGTGKITQALVTGDVSTSLNNLKRTQILYDSNNTPSPNPVFETYDTSSGRGAVIIPYANATNINGIVQQNDTILYTRFPSSANGFSITNSANTTVGLRIASASTTDSTVSLKAGTKDFTMNSLTTAATLNTPLNLNGSTAASRQLQNVGTLGFTDINGTSTSSILMDSTLAVPGIVYDCSLNGGFHIFSANDAGGVKSSPVYYGASLTSISNTFIIRSSVTPTNRFDVLTDAANNTNMRARSVTASTNALININCDTVSAGGVTTNNAVATIAPTYFEFKRPIQLNYTTIPNAMNQIGYQTTTTMSSVNVATSASIRNITTYTFTDAGTYLVHWGISMAMNTGVATFTNLQFGIANTASNTFDTYTFTYPSFVDLKRDYPTLATTDNNIAVPTSCVYRSTTGGKIAYFNYLADYTGGTNVIVGGVFTITRIG